MASFVCPPITYRKEAHTAFWNAVVRERLRSVVSAAIFELDAVEGWVCGRGRSGETVYSLPCGEWGFFLSTCLPLFSEQALHCFLFSGSPRT